MIGLPAARFWASEIADASTAIGRRVEVDAEAALDRSADLGLGRPGLWSPNRSCRLVEAADGWLAVNLPRADDREMVPAWLERDVAGDPWRAIVSDARRRSAMDLLAQARLLGLAVSIVGEVEAAGEAVPARAFGSSGHRRRAPTVIDLSSIWAGPLCAALLAEAGAEVMRWQDPRRPDPSRDATPRLFERLHHRKGHANVDLGSEQGRIRLRDAIADADIVVTSARPRAFKAMGITPETMGLRNPSLIWVAVTGHGWTGAGADRVAFGDDAAAAGGLVRRTRSGAPRFAGDALADPLTGLAAAAAAMRAWSAGGGVFLDAALSRVAADAAIRR